MVDKMVKITDIDLAGFIKADILNNSDLKVSSVKLKDKIMTTDDNKLLRTVLTIGSSKTIIEADVVDVNFLKSHLKFK